MQSLSPLSLVCGVLLCAASVFAAEPIDIGNRRELFVDEYLIDSQTGDIALTLQQPEPREVVLTTDQPWEGNTCAYYSLFQDGDLYRMYYRGSHWDEQTRKGTHREVTCYAESRDGIHWVKPDLGLFEFEGSSANNIVLDGLGTHCFVAFKDENPKAAPEARYKGISRGRPVGEKGLYVFQSPDGIHWSLLHDAPVITEGAFDSQNLAFWHPIERRYIDYHRTFTDGVRAIMRSTSEDFIHWTQPELLTYRSAPNQHLYTNAIRPYPRAPHILVGFPTRFLPNGEHVEPLFMSSRDGLMFDRWNDPVIPQSAPADRAGNRSNYMANGLLSLPGSPREYAVYGTEAYYTGPDSRLRRFTYRLDGFVALRAGAATGSVMTKPLVYDGNRLSLNVKTAPGGSVQVTMFSAEDATGSGPILGESVVFNGDETDHVIDWSNDSLTAYRGQPVRLRIQLTSADLYAFQFVGE